MGKSKYLALLMGEISKGLKIDGYGSSLLLSDDPIVVKIHLDGIWGSFLVSFRCSLF